MHERLTYEVTPRTLDGAEILEAGRGDCSEYATLTVTMLRAVGVPAEVRDGMAAAVTVSNGEGCGAIVPGCGFMPNNMLGEEDLNPGGFHRWRTDTRMTSMMAPTRRDTPMPWLPICTGT